MDIITGLKLVIEWVAESPKKLFTFADMAHAKSTVIFFLKIAQNLSTVSYKGVSYKTIMSV